MKISTATPDEVQAVALAMRESDFEEFIATSFADDRVGLAESLRHRFGGHPDVLCASEGGKPIAICATIESRPNVLTLLFYATDDFPVVAAALSRFVKQRLFPPQVAAGAHRIECVSLVGHELAHRWIRYFGLTQEAVCRGYGKNGETFLQFAWVKDRAGTPGH